MFKVKCLQEKQSNFLNISININISLLLVSEKHLVTILQLNLVLRIINNKTKAIYLLNSIQKL